MWALRISGGSLAFRICQPKWVDKLLRRVLLDFTLVLGLCCGWVCMLVRVSFACLLATWFVRLVVWGVLFSFRGFEVNSNYNRALGFAS